MADQAIQLHAARRGAHRRFSGIEALESRVLLSAAPVSHVAGAVGATIETSVYKYRIDSVTSQSGAATYGKAYTNPQYADAQTYFNRNHQGQDVTPTVPTGPDSTTSTTSTTTTTTTTSTTTTFTTDPVSITQTARGNLTQLTITGTSGNDSIVVAQSGDTLTITANGTTTSVTGTFGEIAIYGNAGDDSVTVQSSVTISSLVYGGAGNNTLIDVAAGKSYIVSLGAGTDSLTGNSHTSFWADSGDAISGGTSTSIHRVTGFYQPFSSTPGTTDYITTNLDGSNLRDPNDAGMTVRLTNSLWGTGATMTDVNQGSIGDCYFLASLQSLALKQPDLLENMAVDLGDGTYAVQFKRNGTTTYVRVDADLSVGSWNGLKYAYPSGGGSMWASIIEKAYAFFRTGAATYASLNWGWTGTAMNDLGVANKTVSADSTTVFDTLKNALANNKAIAAVTASTISSGTPLIGSHAYTIVATSIDSNGAKYVLLRNPWGSDGAGSDSNVNDGLVTVTLAQFQDCFTGGSIQV
jgi:hypothetical protein